MENPDKKQQEFLMMMMYDEQEAKQAAVIKPVRLQYWEHFFPPAWPACLPACRRHHHAMQARKGVKNPHHYFRVF